MTVPDPVPDICVMQIINLIKHRIHDSPVCPAEIRDE